MNSQLERQVPRVLERTLDTSFGSVPEALEAFGLGFGVEKHPLYARIPTGHDPAGKSTGVMKRADNLFGIVRTDTDATLGAVSARYECISQAQALEPFEELVRAGGLTIRRGGALEGGARVWLTAEMAGLEIAGHSISVGITANFRHDGKGALTYAPYFLRDTCFNPLQAISRLLRDFEKGWAAMHFRHTESAIDRLPLVRSQLVTLEDTRAAFAGKAQALLSASFSRGEMEALVRQLLGARPQVRLGINGRPENGRELTSWDSRFEAIMERAWGAPDLSDVRFTRWGALNAISDYEAHLVRVTGTPEARQERLIARTIDGGSLTATATRILGA